MIQIKNFEHHFVDGSDIIIKKPGCDEHILPQFQDEQGYMHVELYCNLKQAFHTKRVHRLVAQAYLRNYSQNLFVDHIDRNKSNNNPFNLCMVTNKQNQQNVNAKGYSFDKANGKWRARIIVDGKFKSLGYFDNEEEARAAYLLAKEKLHTYWASIQEK